MNQLGHLLLLYDPADHNNLNPLLSLDIEFSTFCKLKTHLEEIKSVHPDTKPCIGFQLSRLRKCYTFNFLVESSDANRYARAKELLHLESLQ
jgi:hypothetical protein